MFGTVLAALDDELEPTLRGSRPMVAKVILAADGSDDARIRYSTFLQFGGFVVLEARTGAEAVELLRTEPAAALIVALRPVAAGLELLERVRAEGGDARVPVLLLADDDSAESRARAASAGCAAYLVRPCPPHDLLQALCAVIDRGAAVSPAHGAARDPVHTR